MSIDKLNLTNDEKIIFVNAINELSGRIRERESEIQALKVAVDLLRKQEGAEPYYGLIPSFCAERSTPDSAAAAQGDKSKLEQTIDQWRNTLQDESKVTDDDAEDLLFRLIPLTRAQEQEVNSGEKAKR